MSETNKLQILCNEFISEKIALGYKFKSNAGIINRFVRNYISVDINILNDDKINLTKEHVLKCTEKFLNQSNSTVYRNISAINKFLDFIIRRGYQAYIVPTKMLPKFQKNFKAKIFSDEEISRLFAAANSVKYTKQNPLKIYQIPLMFSILINCGLRESELLNLRICDINLNENIFTILDTKFHKDRYIPFSDVVANDLKKYIEKLNPKSNVDWLFPSPKTGGIYNNSIVNLYFREILRLAGFSHGGHGKGPRPHDLRHTFAVHCLNNWALTDVDLSVALPVLSRYMGHSGISGTQKYLQLTAQMYPDILAKTQEKFGYLIPIKEAKNETN